MFGGKGERAKRGIKLKMVEKVSGRAGVDRIQSTGREIDFRKENESTPSLFLLASGNHEPHHTSQCPKRAVTPGYLGMVCPPVQEPLYLPCNQICRERKREAGKRNRVPGAGSLEWPQMLEAFHSLHERMPQKCCQTVEGLGLFSLYIRN